jgi:hypothetical protein
MRAAGAWLLVLVAASCGEEMPPPPQWTWASATGTGGIREIEAGLDGQMVTARTAQPGTSIEMLDGHAATVWSRRLSASDSLYVGSLAVGDDGTTYVGGTYEGTITVETDDGETVTAMTELCHHSYGDRPCQEGFVIAYDEQGSLRWWQRTEGTREGGSIVRAVSNDVIVGSTIQAPAEPAPGEQVSPSWLNQIAVTRLDGDGGQLWRYQHPMLLTSDADRYVYASIHDLAVDAQGGTFLSIWYLVQPTNDYFELLKLDAGGGLVWSISANGGRLAVTEDGDVVVAGQFNFAGVEQVGDYTLYANRHDGATGALRWQRFLGGSGSQVYPSDVAVDPAGDVVLFGSTTGPTLVGDIAVGSTDAPDVLVVRLRGRDGRPEAATTFGFAGSDSGGKLLLLDRDDMVISGSFSDGTIVVDSVSYTPAEDDWGTFLRRGDPFAPSAP